MYLPVPFSSKPIFIISNLLRKINMAQTPNIHPQLSYTRICNLGNHSDFKVVFLQSLQNQSTTQKKDQSILIAICVAKFLHRWKYNHKVNTTFFLKIPTMLLLLSNSPFFSKAKQNSFYVSRKYYQYMKKCINWNILVFCLLILYCTV